MQRYLGTDKVGVITRINNALDSIMKSIPIAQDKLQNLQKQSKTAQENMSIPFEKEEELQATLKRLKEINAELKIGETNSSEVVEVDDDEMEIDDYEKQKSRQYVR